MKHTRRNVVGAMIGGAVGATGLARTAFANTGAQLPVWGDATPGTAKAGPLGLTTAAREAPEVPVAIEIPDAEVNAEIEINKIVDGQMLDPTGPWIVSWYEGTGLLHEPDRNLLMSGHVDYWGVGPAIFRNVASLPEGAEVTVYGDKGGAATYSVEYVKRISANTVTPEELAEITGATDYEAITLITCGGTFDYAAGEYLERDIIRCRLVGQQAPEAAAGDTATETPAATDGGQAASITQDGVNLRADASTVGDPVRVLNTGDTINVTGDAVEADGYRWYPVQLEDGTQGWVVADFVDLPQ
jgi:sortase (surface protein transpeptidase)